MKFRVQKSAMLSAIQAGKSIVPTKSQITIATCFLLRLKQNCLEIISSDIAAFRMQLNLGVEGLSDGEIAVNAQEFTTAVSAARDGELTIYSEDLTFIVSWGDEKQKSKIAGIDSKDYMQAPEVVADCEFELDVPALAFLNSKVSFAVSKEINSSRPALTGILFENVDERLCVVGTDSHRLARLYMQTQGELEGGNFSLHGKHIILPKSIQVLLTAANAVGDSEKLVKISLSETHIKLQTENVLVISKLIDGSYPDWKPVVPSNLPISIKVNSAEMLDVLQRANNFPDKELHTARLTVQGSVLHVSATGISSFEDYISCETEGLNEESMNLGVNLSYLIEILKICNSQEVTILVNGEHSLCEVLPNGKDEDILFLIMLLRL